MSSNILSKLYVFEVQLKIAAHVHVHTPIRRHSMDRYLVSIIAQQSTDINLVYNIQIWPDTVSRYIFNILCPVYRR